MIGFGDRKAPEAFVNACSTFLFLDDEEERPAKKRKPNELRGDCKLMNPIRDAIAGAGHDDGWASLSRMGSHISNLDPRNDGYSRLSDLIEAIGLFEVRRTRDRYIEVRDGKKKS